MADSRSFRNARLLQVVAEPSSASLARIARRTVRVREEEALGVVRRNRAERTEVAVETRLESFSGTTPRRPQRLRPPRTPSTPRAARSWSRSARREPGRVPRRPPLPEPRSLLPPGRLPVSDSRSASAAFPHRCSSVLIGGFFAPPSEPQPGIPQGGPPRPSIARSFRFSAASPRRSSPARPAPSSAAHRTARPLRPVVRPTAVASSRARRARRPLAPVHVRQQADHDELDPTRLGGPPRSS